MAKDWDAVAQAIVARMTELDMSKAELIRATRLAPMTVHEIMTNEAVRKRSPRTLEAMSVALRWPPNHLGDVLDGSAGEPGHVDPISQLQAEVDDLRTRVAELEKGSQG